MEEEQRGRKESSRVDADVAGATENAEDEKRCRNIGRNKR